MRRRDLLAGLGALGLTGPARATPRPGRARRVCLSVGISHYRAGPALPSALPDARLIARGLSAAGFAAYLLEDPTQEELLLALAALRLQAARAELAVIYVAGHGFMCGGQGHVLPADAPFDGTGALPESLLLQAISDQPRQRVLFLDTCRETAPVRPADPACPVAAPHSLGGVHVGYATQPGAPALDGADGHSPFARALYRLLQRPGLDLGELSRQLRLDVLRETQGRQIPWERSSLLAPVTLNPAD